MSQMSQMSQMIPLINHLEFVDCLFFYFFFTLVHSYYVIHFLNERKNTFYSAQVYPVQYYEGGFNVMDAKHVSQLCQIALN